MSPDGGAHGVPSRSEIEEWSTRDLDAAAARWRTSATESDEAFAQHRANIANTPREMAAITATAKAFMGAVLSEEPKWLQFERLAGTAGFRRPWTYSAGAG